MTVQDLKKMLENLPDDAKVYTKAPEGNAQEIHECAARCLVVNSGRTAVWFESYADEDIGAELQTLDDWAINEGWSDEDLVDAIFNEREHGYTMEDVRKNAEHYLYCWLLDNDYRREMYPADNEALFSA